MFHQQGFVAGGCHFCYKDLVVCVEIRLFFPCEEAVEGMTHFMCQCEHAVDGVVMVQQHEGVYAIAAPGVGAAALAFVFIYIDPAAFQTVLQCCAVFFAHDLQGFFDSFFCFCVRDLHICIRHQGHIQVIHVQFVYAQFLFADGNITMQQRQVFVDSLDQVIIYGQGDVVIRQSHFHSRVIFSCFGKENIALYGRRIGCCNGIFLAQIYGVQVFERLFTDTAVRTFQKCDVSALCQFQFFAIGCLNGRECDICVVQHGEDLLRSTAQFCCFCQQVFFCRSQCMGFLAQQCVEEMIVDGEICGFFFAEGCKFLFRNGNDFRSEERNRCGITDQQHFCSGCHTLIKCIGTVFVHTHICVSIDMVQF